VIHALLLLALAQAQAPALEGVPVRVERRLLVKAGHVFVTGGLNYFIRGDYYVSPGLIGTAAYYPSEQSGLEVKAGLFISFVSPAAQEVFNATGFVPNAAAPWGLLMAGYRQSVGYGKMMIAQTPASLVHFDFQLAGHAGFVFTNHGPSPALAVSPGVLLRLDSSLAFQCDIEVYASLEDREGFPVAFGVLPTLTAGVSF